MQSLLVLLLFVGLFMIVHGVYDEKFRSLKDNVRVEYRFVPRTYYEEQLSSSDVSSKFKNMFEDASPWQERNMGGSVDSG
jgi:adenosine deaminase